MYRHSCVECGHSHATFYYMYIAITSSTDNEKFSSDFLLFTAWIVNSTATILMCALVMLYVASCKTLLL